jgi:plastocyanin
MNNIVCPQSLTVSRGAQVTFSNQDAIAHEMDSDPHPEHTDCVEINQVDFLNPGQSKQTGNLNTARRCGFHDHRSPGTAGLKGTITIQ